MHKVTYTVSEIFEVRDGMARYARKNSMNTGQIQSNQAADIGQKSLVQGYDGTANLCSYYGPPLTKLAAPSYGPCCDTYIEEHKPKDFASNMQLTVGCPF